MPKIADVTPASQITTDAIDTVIEALERAPRILVPLIEEVPEEHLTTRPRDGRWSVHEHGCHLALVHPMIEQRLDQMLREDVPRFEPYLPDGDADAAELQAMDLAESLARFTRERAQLVERLRQLSHEDWARTADHGEYSHYSVFIMLRHLVMHDMLHGYRVEEILLAKD